MPAGLLALALALTWLGGCGAPPPSAPSLEMPDVMLQSLDGRPVPLSGYRGKVLLIDFWATWCTPCQESIPILSRLQRRYGDRGFQVIGIALDVGGSRVVAPYAAQWQVDYDVLLGDERTTQAFGGIPGIPTSFLVDRKGQIVRRFVGLVDPGEYESSIKTLL